MICEQKFGVMLGKNITDGLSALRVLEMYREGQKICAIRDFRGNLWQGAERRDKVLYEEVRRNKQTKKKSVRVVRYIWRNHTHQ